LVTIFMIPLAFAIAFFANGLSTMVFGREFAPMDLPLQILLVGALFGSIIGAVGSALSSTRFVNVLFKLVGLTLICNIVLNVLLIPRFGITGAAIANSVTIFANFLLGLYIIQRLIKVKIDWAWLARLISFTLLLAGVTYAVKLFINPYISVPIAMGVLVLILCKYFVSGEDIATIRRVLSQTTHSKKKAAAKPRP